MLNYFSYSLLIRNLWLRNIHIQRKLTSHPINKNIQMQFTHSLNDGLGCFVIYLHLKRRILGSQPLQRGTQLILISLCFGFDCYFNHRIRKFNPFKYYRLIGFTESIACRRVL